MPEKLHRYVRIPAGSFRVRKGRPSGDRWTRRKIFEDEETGASFVWYYGARLTVVPQLPKPDNIPEPIWLVTGRLSDPVVIQSEPVVEPKLETDAHRHKNPDGSIAVFINSVGSRRVVARAIVHEAELTLPDGDRVETSCPVSSRRTARPSTYFVTQVPTFVNCKACLRRAS